MDLIWGQPVASTDAWAGTVAGAVVAVDRRAVTRLVVKRGLVFPRRYAVPMAHLRRWDLDGLYLDIDTTTLFGFRSGREPAAPSVPVASGTRVAASDGAVLHVRGLRVRGDEGSLSHLVVSRSRRTGRRFLAPEAMVVELSAAGIRLAVDAAELEGLPTHRTDAAVHEELWETLYDSQAVPPVDLGGMRLEVSEGVVRLEGNARSATAISDAERIVRSVGGVAGVDNRLVSDWEIELAAASGIAGVAPELAGSVSAHTQLGTVQMEGWVPSDDARRAVVEAVASVAGVLSVEDALSVRPPPDKEPASG